MTIGNLTEVRNLKTFEQLACSAELTGGIHSQLICLTAINIFLSITAFLGNTLILVALHKESSLHPPSKLLFRSLATTDLCVGIIVEPFVVTYFMSAMNEQWNICRWTFILAFMTGYILGSVSLFTMTAISLDRLLALLLGIRYRHVVTLKRTYITIAVSLVVSIFGTVMYFSNYVITVWYGCLGISVCLVTSVFTYTKIFFSLRHRHFQVQDHVHQRNPSQTSPLNVARYRKTVSSALWVQLTLVVCYLPFGIMEALLAQGDLPPTVYLSKAFALTLVYLNSSLNPILYCWKIREVRQAVKDTIRNLFRSSS